MKITQFAPAVILSFAALAFSPSALAGPIYAFDRHNAVGTEWREAMSWSSSERWFEHASLWDRATGEPVHVDDTHKRGPVVMGMDESSNVLLTSTDGVGLFIDAEERDDKDHLITLTVFVVGPKDSDQPQEYETGLRPVDCRGSGGSIVVLHEDAKGDPVSRSFYFTQGGSRISDKIGTMLCNIHAVAEEIAIQSQAED